MKLIKIIPDSQWGKPSYNWTTGPLMGFDIESTAVDIEHARIVQMALVIDDPIKGTNTVHKWLVNPGCSIPLGAIAVHGINDDQVQMHGVNPDVALIEFMSVMTELRKEYPHIPIVITNANYDCSLLDREYYRHFGLNLDINKMPFIADSLILDRLADPWRRGRRTLTATCANYNITMNGAHQADNDVIASIKLMRAIGKKYHKVARCDLKLLQKIQQDAHDEWCNNYSQYQQIENPDFSITTRGWPIIERIQK